MFNQGLGFLRIHADDSYMKRVFKLHLKRHQDDLLGLGYHHYRQSGRGFLEFSCSFRDLFFGQGFHPDTAYQRQGIKHKICTNVSEAIASYDPETEVVTYLKIHHSDLTYLTRISKRGLALSVIHRQYLTRLLSRRTLIGSVPP